MSKQSKQYESMRQTQANTFSDGLNMDLHPLTTPNTILTDCVNGTMITYNDNEFVLQNERGNSKIDGAKLNPGFIPVGMKEHNGILYIVSHNPQTKENEIGTYPSPAQNYLHNESKYDANVSTELFSTYSDMNNNALNYYDYNLTVTNYDEYILTKNDNNPLLVLENHVLDKKGKLHKIELNPDNIVHRFLHQGDGILGYKYRPYYINSFNTWITPTSGSNQAKLNLKFSSIDQELKNNFNNLEFKCEINVILKDYNENKDIPSLNKTYIFNKTNITTYYDLEGFITEILDFSKLYDNTSDLKYDYVNRVLINKTTGTKHDMFIITSTFYICKEDYKLEMDHMIQTLNVPVYNICNKPQFFDIFKYRKNESGKLDIVMLLNMLNYDINWTESSTYTFGEASYKLLKVDKNGNIEGKDIDISNVSDGTLSPEALSKLPTYNVIPSNVNINPKIGDLKAISINNDPIYHFISKDSTISIDENLQILNVKGNEENTCNFVNENKQITKVQYIKNNNGDYNILLLNDSYEIIQKYQMDPSSPCDSLKDMVDELWVEPNKLLKYSINDLIYEPNSVYLLQLTFSINEISNIASFFIVTTDQMLTEEHYRNDRMDLLTIDDWFTPEISSEVIIDVDNCEYTCNNISNPLDTIDIIEKSDNIEKLAINRFLSYKQIIDKDSDDDIPSLGKRYSYKVVWNNKSEIFDVDFIYRGLHTNNYSENGAFYNKIKLIVESSKSDIQKSIRRYIYDNIGYSNFNPFECKTIIPYKVYKGLNDNDLIYEFSNPAKRLAKFVNTDIPDEDTFLLSKGKLYKSSKTRYVNYLQGACHKPLKVERNEWHSYWTINESNDTDLNPRGDCGTTQLMVSDANLGRYFHYGKITEFGKKNRVAYNGELEKIWTRGKYDNSYVLLGFNLGSNTVESIKNICETLLHHWYYLEKIDPKDVYQNIYKTENGVIDIDVSTKNFQNHTINCNILPTECRIVNLNLDEYNIQSYNNVTVTTTKNYSVDATINNSLLSISNECKQYLQYLGLLINKYPLEFDTNDAGTNELFYDVNDLQLNPNDLTGGINLSDTALPSFGYDPKHHVIYKNITQNENKDGFYYTNKSNCVPQFNWNFSQDWPFKIDATTAELWKEYHSLWFYKLTNYKISDE